MVRTVVLFLGFLVFPSLLFSQDSFIDSLKLLLNHSNDRHLKLNLSRQIAAKSKNPTEVFQFAQKASSLAKELDDVSGKAYSLYYQGRAYALQNILDSADYFLQKSFLLAQQQRDNFLAANSLLEKGGIQYTNSAFENAIDLYTRALRLFEKIAHKENITKTFTFLGKAYRHIGANDKAIWYLEQACEMAQTLGNNTLMVNSWIDLAKAFMNAGLFEKAAPVLEKTIKLPPNDSRQLRKAYNQLGITYNRLSLFDKALLQLNKGYTLSQNSGDSSMMASVLINEGVAYSRMGNLSKALEVYDKSVNILSQLNNLKGLSNVYHNIGKIYKQLGDTDQAMDSYQRSLKIKLDIGEKEGAGRTYNNMANILSDEKKYVESLEYYFMANEMHLASGNRRSQALTLANIAEAYSFLERYKESLEYGYSSLDIFQEINDKGGLSFTLETLAKVYLQLHKSPDDIQLDKYGQKSILEIETMLLRALELSEETQDFDYLINIYYTLTEFYRGQNQPKKALNYQDKYLAAKDSIYSIEKLSAVAEMQTRFDTESKIRENTFLRDKNRFFKSRNQTFLAIAIVLLFLLITSALFYLKLRTAKTQLERQNKTIENQNKALTSLNKTKDRFFGIIAHDLKSPLIALRGLGGRIDFLLQRNDQQQLNELGLQVDQTATKLNDLLDNLLSWASLQTGDIPYQPGEVNLQDLSEEVILLFSNLIKINKLQVINQIDSETLVFADERALDTIFRNLIGNAIKFTPKNGIIQLEAFPQGSKTCVQVKDNGQGIPKELVDKLFSSEKTSMPGVRGEKGTGLGLLLCKELLEINKGSISVSSKKGEGSIFSFYIPKL